MKKTILILSLTLASLLLALSGIGKTESSKQVDGRRQPVYDIDGKRLRADEKYLAGITLESGRVIAYRKNRREIAALVKALKEDGVTDKKLLDPRAWMMNTCEQTAVSECNGGCGIAHHCKGFRETINRLSDAHTLTWSYCFCVP